MPFAESIGQFAIDRVVADLSIRCGELNKKPQIAVSVTVAVPDL